MKIEQELALTQASKYPGLNPYSNGMKIELMSKFFTRLW